MYILFFSIRIKNMPHYEEVEQLNKGGHINEN